MTDYTLYLLSGNGKTLAGNYQQFKTDLIRQLVHTARAHPEQTVYGLTDLSTPLGLLWGLAVFETRKHVDNVRLYASMPYSNQSLPYNSRDRNLWTRLVDLADKCTLYSPDSDELIPRGTNNATSTGNARLLVNKHTSLLVNMADSVLGVAWKDSRVYKEYAGVDKVKFVNAGKYFHNPLRPVIKKEEDK